MLEFRTPTKIQMGLEEFMYKAIELNITYAKKNLLEAV